MSQAIKNEDVDEDPHHSQDFLFFTRSSKRIDEKRADAFYQRGEFVISSLSPVLMHHTRLNLYLQLMLLSSKS